MSVTPFPEVITDLIDRTILDNIDDAAACSHRPDNVRYWLDANSRRFLATRISEALFALDETSTA